MTNNWFELEQMMRSRQRDLLREAAELHRAELHRKNLRKESQTGPTLSARLGGMLVAIGRRLQGASAVTDAETCGVCGKHFTGLGPVTRA